jgi:hypothetical protein
VAAYLKWLNLVLAALALLLLAVALQSAGDRAPGALFVGAPLCLAQLFGGLVPSVLCVRERGLTGAARWWLLAPAVGGVVCSAAAAMLSLATCGGC